MTTLLSLSLFLLPKTFKLFDFPIFRIWAYLMKVMSETWLLNEKNKYVMIFIWKKPPKTKTNKQTCLIRIYYIIYIYSKYNVYFCHIFQITVEIKDKMKASVKYQYGNKIRTNSTNRMITDAWDSMQRKVCNSRNIDTSVLLNTG